MLVGNTAGGVLACIGKSGNKLIPLRPFISWTLHCHEPTFNPITQAITTNSPIALLAIIPIFFLCLPQSPSPNIALTPSPRVYISCCRLLHGVPEFILQPVVMARFLDQSWQLLAVDS